MSNFKPLRRIPILVLVALANQPLVQAGGPVNSDEIREDWIDNDANAWRKADGLCYFAAHDNCGEPYANWL
jgi:hypothetical protein